MADADSQVAAPAAKFSHTLRVTFAYAGRSVRLVKSLRVAMISPPSVTPVPDKEQSGYWFEVRNAEGALLFHRALGNPVRTDIEVHSGDARRSITRVPVAEPEGEFEMLVPDLPDARSFAFYGTPPGGNAAYTPSRELLRIDFDALRSFRADRTVSDTGADTRGGNTP